MMATSSMYHHAFEKMMCPPPSFPDNFKDFFTTLTEDDDSVDIIATMLEDKLIPRSANTVEKQKEFEPSKRPFGRRGMSARHFQRRSSDAHNRLRQPLQHQNACNDLQQPVVISPGATRRRSSSIAVTRPPPDLHRFLQTEKERPWGHLNPNPQLLSPMASTSTGRCHLNLNSATSPGAVSASGSSRLQHLSPGASSNSRESPSPRGRYCTSPTPIDNSKTKSRSRTASMPAVARHRPMLAETRRSAVHTGGIGVGAAGGGADNDDGDDVEYYRVRSFSITANGISNLGDSLKSRRSRSINSVTSTGTSGSGNSYNRDRLLSSASQNSTTGCEVNTGNSEPVTSYKVGMLGAAGVGKTALTYQFTTSEYICAYDASLDDEYGQKTVSVMLDGQETELEVLDHPTSEMSVESFCATYNVDVFVVVYSVVDRKTLKAAEDILLYLWKADYMATKAVILVANKADLERKREVPMVVGRRLANSCGCKFIETSSGLDHNVDELLVGILAQVKLNPKRDRNQINRKRRHKVRIGSGRRILRNLLGLKRKTRSCENLFVL